MNQLVTKLATAAVLTLGTVLATAPAQASYGYGHGHSHGYRSSSYYPVCTIVYREFYNGYAYVSRPVRVCH